MIDNFEQIKKLLIFSTEDDFYFSQIIQRKKENPEVGSNSHVVKTYYIRKPEDLDFNKGEMICLANFHNARVCINLNRRSFEKVAFQNIRKISDIIMNKDFKSVRKAYNSVCGAYSNESLKNWIIDIDEKSIDIVDECIKTIEDIDPLGQSKIVDIIETKHGWHIISNPFNIEQFRKVFKYDIHKDNPTIIYIPDERTKTETVC